MSDILPHPNKIKPLTVLIPDRRPTSAPPQPHCNVLLTCALGPIGNAAARWPGNESPHQPTRVEKGTEHPPPED